jgi:hypothetical protein
MARILAHMSRETAICPRSCVRPVGEPVHDERPHYRRDVPNAGFGSVLSAAKRMPTAKVP